MSRILGIDFGDKRVGLALGESGGSAFPFKVISNEGEDILIKNITEIIRAEHVGLVVVGLPLSLSGAPNERWQLTKNFIDRLASALPVPVETMDERLTSKLYSRQGVSRDIDKHAAAAILDTYLQANVS
ncbi:MAG: Holliday junction resolvase RuvX [Parcubacteria group bacterium]|nr:MAG: Holliday junction resolvase RuvX [Parcubacteria group bacterium]